MRGLDLRIYNEAQRAKSLRQRLERCLMEGRASPRSFRLVGADVGMEIGAVAARGDEAGADHVVAEALALPPFFGISRKQRFERGNDTGVIEIFRVKLVHARAVEGRAEVEIVAARPLPDDAYFGEVGPRAAVRATRHANHDVVRGQTVRGEFLVERIEKLRHVALALGQGEAAGRQRNAGHRIAPQSGPWREQARLARDALDLSLLLRRHIGNDKVLVWRDAEIAVVYLCNRAQRALLRGAGNIAHASVLHEQREVAAA